MIETACPDTVQLASENMNALSIFHSFKQGFRFSVLCGGEGGRDKDQLKKFILGGTKGKTGSSQSIFQPSNKTIFFMLIVWAYIEIVKSKIKIPPG